MFGWAPTDGGSRWPVCLDIGHPVEKTLLGINIGRRINIRINIRKGSERLCPCPPSTAASEHTLISIFKFQICVGSACLVPSQNAAASSIYSDFKWGARMCLLRVPPTLDFNIQIWILKSSVDFQKMPLEQNPDINKSQNWLFHSCCFKIFRFQLSAPSGRRQIKM